jgi:NAD(P)-dependent dehydrogenase (short-subunit alcohol dehydrogenase family)
MELDGKLVIVTGGSGALGGPVTNAFEARGARVIAVGRSARPSDPSRPNVIPMAADMTSSREVQNLVAEAIARFGGIDVVVHLMGGFAGGHDADSAPDDELDRMIDANLRSAWNVFRAAIPTMKGHGGAILAVGSRSAVEPSPGSAAYAASKAALVSLVKSIAAEVSLSGIRVNVVLPGTLDTAANRQAMPEADRSGWVPPENVASLLVWLASEAGRSVNGAAVPIYGGG